MIFKSNQLAIFFDVGARMTCHKIHYNAKQIVFNPNQTCQLLSMLEEITYYHNMQNP
jgi:hypothetical protein